MSAISISKKEIKRVRKDAIKAIKRGESVIYNCEIVGNTIQAYERLNCIRSVVMHHHIKVQKYDQLMNSSTQWGDGDPKLAPDAPYYNRGHHHDNQDNP